MTQEEKSLLLRDLCARLPYGVKVCAGEDLAMTLKQIDYKCFCESWENEDLKCHSRWMFPYLRPMSSMTEEEKEEYINIKQGECNGCVLTGKGDPNTEFLLVDFFNAHHFDYRGLIEKGLALEAPEGMYNIK
jgi:hypothetical protein